MKILLIDIETSPIRADVWGLWNQNIGLPQIHQPGQVICFAAKWLDSDRVFFYSDYHHGHEVMIDKAHQLLDEADAVIHYNGKKFDIPWLMTEFVQAGLLPPSPFKEIDLLVTARRVFRFPSNKLQYVATALGVGSKVQHEGHELWVKCMAGDPKAWARMRRYCKQDTVLLGPLYYRLLPYIRNHPHRGLFAGEIAACENCGSKNLQRRGEARTQLGAYVRYQCMDCGKWNKGAKRVFGVDTRGEA